MSLKKRGIQMVGLGGILLACASSALTPACAETPTRECRVGADCATGICGDDGQCVREGTPGLDAGAGNDADASTSGDGATTDGPTGDSALPGCVPNKDLVITAAEVPIAAGLHATYAIGTNENVSTAGVTGPGGQRTWDFSAKLASDEAVIVETQSLKGKWFEADYAGATYATKLQKDKDLLGIFETSPGALLLRGVASPADGSSKTEVTYTPAVSVLKFPLTVGASWTTSTTATGPLNGFDIATYAPTTDKYESKVDASGELKTPLGTFGVLRVSTLLTRKVGFVPVTTTIRTFAFVTECYGTVATVTSADNEANEEFTSAKEIRRIAP